MKKRVLITGEDSYIGDSFYNANKNFFDIEILSVRGNDWKEFDMSNFDSVFHVAGIVHIKETEDNKELYYEVNRDLDYNPIFYSW